MIKKAHAFAAFFALISMAGGVQAGGDPEAGKAKSDLCQGCHGGDGMSVNPECPNLAGQKAGYIVKQVTDFQKGHRNNDTMSPMAGMVENMQDLKDIAVFFSSMNTMTAAKFMTPAPSDKKLIAQGEKLYAEGNMAEGLYACVNCHGQKGKGKDASNQIFPVIGGQHEAYLRKQLTDFRAAARTNDPAGMMGDIAKRIGDNELDALVAYLSNQ